MPEIALCQEVVDNIIDWACRDFPTLAALCCVSRACANTARQHLYKEVIAVSGCSFSESRFRHGNFKQADVVQANLLLQTYVKSLVITVHQPASMRYLASPRLEMLLLAPKLPNLERLHLQLGREEEILKEHFPIPDTVRPSLQLLLASSKLISLSVDIFTSGSINNEEFPGWIFTDLSKSVKELQLSVRYASWVNSEDLSLSYWGPQEKRHQLEAFSFNALNYDDNMARCAAILSGKNFRLDLSQLKSLTVTHIHGDGTLWTLPDQNAKTLEELTILQFPSTTLCGLQLVFRVLITFTSRRAAFTPLEYRALQTLNFSIPFDNNYRTRERCKLLTKLCSQQLPPTLSHVSIQFILGQVGGEYAVPTVDPENVECWNGLVKTICSQPSISSLAIRLLWTFSTAIKPYWQTSPDSFLPEDLEERKQEERKKREQWESDVQGVLAGWRKVFDGVGERDADLFLSYSREYRNKAY